MPAASESIWVPNLTREVTPGTYYRFGVVAPNTWTQDAAHSFLETRGWDVKAFELPRPDVAQALKDFTAIGFQTPNAWFVHAYWRGAAGMLPMHDGQLYYGPVEYSAPGVPGSTSPTDTPESKAPIDDGIATVLAIAASFGLLAVASYFAMARNRR